MFGYPRPNTVQVIENAENGRARSEEYNPKREKCNDRESAIVNRMHFYIRLVTILSGSHSKTAMV